MPLYPKRLIARASFPLGCAYVSSDAQEKEVYIMLDDLEWSVLITTRMLL